MVVAGRALSPNFHNGICKWVFPHRHENPNPDLGTNGVWTLVVSFALTSILTQTSNFGGNYIWTCVAVFQYIVSKNCMMEFRFACIQLNLPIILAIVGTGRNWETSEVSGLCVLTVDLTRFWYGSMQITRIVNLHSMSGWLIGFFNGILFGERKKNSESFVAIIAKSDQRSLKTGEDMYPRRLIQHTVGFLLGLWLLTCYDHLEPN